jgi:hypothetical protein
MEICQAGCNLMYCDAVHVKTMRESALKYSPTHLLAVLN